MNKVEELQFKLQEHVGEEYVVKCWAVLTRKLVIKVNVDIYKYEGMKLVYADNQKINAYTPEEEVNFDKLEERVCSWHENPSVTWGDLFLLLKFLLGIIVTIVGFVTLFFLSLGLIAFADISVWIVIPSISFLFYYYCIKMYELIFK